MGGSVDLPYTGWNLVKEGMSPTIGVSRSLKTKKLNPKYVEPFQILSKARPVAYKLGLLLNLSQIHDVFYVSQLKKHHLNPAHVKVEPERIIDKNVKQLRNKQILLVKVVWKGLSPEEATWEMEAEIKENYPKHFP
ncbi:uncharacterized protein LOC114755880 [Neltuma alba]|uniref:uncharacterized protein LOC114755880 n=1 Tax=Neltuma alba TaxID=207710 RepID=UPI0010A2AFDB|nr:uncharacterized protein LOC114755880 [Prosopis alba]